MPESISSIRLLPRQCRLVGKLMINFGLVGVRVSNTNILPRPNFPACAGGFISFEILREIVLELQRDATPHDADAVDRVDECLHVSL